MRKEMKRFPGTPGKEKGQRTGHCAGSRCRSVWRSRYGLSLALAVMLAVAGGAPEADSGGIWGPGAFPSYGAEDSSIIESLSVSFKTTYGEQEEIPEPEITVSGTGCTMGDYQYRTDYEKWKPGKKVRVEITVHADEGKYFPSSINRSKCKVSGAEFVSAKALDGTTMQVKADYKPVTVLGDTTEAGWSSSKKRAVWKSVEHAPGYMVNLYGDNKVVKRLTVETNSVNLTEYMDDIDKTYYYEVKAVPVTSDQKKYLKEGNFVTSSDQEFDWDDFQTNSGSSSGTSPGTSSAGPGTGPGGSSPGSSYGNGSSSSVVTAGTGGSGGTYTSPTAGGPRNMWRQTGGQWSYFDGAGNMVKGWLQYGGSSGPWYYLDQNGIMSTGWVQVGGSWFYLGEDGRMQTGWIQPVPNTWYYTDQNGYMQTGWIQVGGKSYYLDSSGAMAANRVVDGRQLGPDGAVVE